MNILPSRKSRNSERGVALILALLTLLLISAIVMGMVFMSNTETNVSSNFRDEQTAFFAARAGVEEVRDRMRAGAPNSLFGLLPLTALPGALNGVVYVTNPAAGEVVAPWSTGGNNYPDDEICKEVTCSAAGVPVGPWFTPAQAQAASATYAAAPILPWKWVRLMAKMNKSSAAATRVVSVDGAINGNRVCWNGANEVTTAAASCGAANPNYLPVYELTALAVTPSGSRRMTQYEVNRTPWPVIPGAFVFDGSNPSFNPPSSHPFSVSGTDADQGPTAGVGCPTALNQPALGAFDNGSVSSLDNTLLGPPNRSSNYTSGTTPTPAVVNVNTALSSGAINLTTVDGLTKLSNMITSAAGPNVYPNGTVPGNMGTNTSPVINVVNGDVTLTGSGTGILLVTGQLTLNGNFSYNGIILVIGEGAVMKNGGGSATVNGAMFAANLFTENPGTTGPGAYPAYTHPIALGSNLAPGIPFFGWNGGGSATIQYDSCWIAAVTQSLPYNIVAQRELVVQ